MPVQGPIRVLLVGTGFGSKVHAPGFASDPAFRLVGVASGHLENAKKVADAHAIPHATDDWKKLLDDVEADLVSISTPVDLHYPMARAALERDRHVLLEKPFALNAAQAKELAALAKSRGVVAVVNHEFRHQPGRATLTRWIEEGRLGRIEHLVMRTRLPGWGRDPNRRLTWLTEKERGGGFLGALGSHDVDQLLLWGGPIRRVFCRLRLLAPTAPGVTAAHRAISAEDCYTIFIEFANGATGLVDTFGGSRVRQERYEAFGSDDAFVVLNGDRIGRPNEKGGFDDLPIPEDLQLKPTPEIPLLAPFRVKVAMLREAILNGAAATPSFAEALEVQKVLDAARKSDQTGTWVDLEE
ncbi:MAG: Gfo/Idh/MocA family oxidoreductase [Candidatus Eisenbacteria bacterium]|uniref:Gfo/Idh/MocA family oxidoreductase n=1 Tax=Eiseniibacteriota bacterium TaxID=2212470 RepID=A0A538TUW3_UNCEI|nr:MAG: Gfo/Idh/MocA family oxidoreductase [Candidatus Eisenbacteria bacterium]